MNIAEYISSGLLESYVIGLTSEEENRQMRKLIQESSEVREELLQIEEALLTHASQQVSSPPLTLKNNVTEKIFVSKENKIITHPATASINSTGNFLRYLAAASVILFFVSGFRLMRALV